MACIGCGRQPYSATVRGTVPVAGASAPVIGNEGPSIAAMMADVSISETPVPLTPCKCGRSPWWWLIVAAVVGYLIAKEGRK